MTRCGGSWIIGLLLALLLFPEVVFGQELIRRHDPKQFGVDTAEGFSNGRRHRYVRLEVLALSGSSLILRLFNDANYKAERKRSERHFDNDVWVGQVVNEPLSSVVFSLHDSGVLFGKIEVRDRTFLIKHFWGQVYEIVETDSGVAPQNEADGDDFIVYPDEDPLRQDQGGFTPRDNQLGKTDAESACLASTSCGPKTIDVMVIYTAAARTALGGTDALAQSAIAAAVAEIGDAFSNTSISHAVNLVYSGEVVYTETGNSSTDLSNLAVNGEGFMDEIHAIRDAYGADLVSLITYTGGCGIGYVSSSPTNMSSGSGFSVVRHDCLVTNKSLAHEMGHNMGLHHDWYVNNSTTPCTWHHGYVNQAALGGSAPTEKRWRTIMAYNDQCSDRGFNCTRLTYYSNPANTYTGDPMGVPQNQSQPADGVFALERTACQVAEYRATVVGPAPIANFSADETSGMTPLSVSFTDLSTNTPTSWSWDFGDSGTSTSQSPAHDYMAPGTYTVTLTASNSDGSDQEVKTNYITVNPPSPVAAFTADVTSGYPSLSVNFTDQSTNSPTSWSWDFGDGGSSTSQNPSHSYTEPGIYTVSLTATNVSGSDQEVKTGYITVFGLVTKVFQHGLNGYGGARDTKIKSDFPSTNYGSDLSLEVDGSPDYAAILGWNVSSIPPGVVVLDVDVGLNVTDPTTDSYEFYEMKRAWVESQATFQVYASGQSWQTAGANGANDRGSTILGSASAASTGMREFALNDDGVALVQGWIDNPGSNNGLILLDYGTPTNGLDFDSKETATVANRPKLTIRYSTGGNLAPEASFEGVASVGNAPLNVAFNASESSDPDGSIVSYGWTFGDGGSGSGVTTSHVYSAGSYTARLIVTDNDGAADTTYQQIHAVAPGSISFAVLGDFGSAGPAEADVAAEVISWNPDFIVTVGDNNYPSGEIGTIDANVGQYYSDFIYPYTGGYGSTASANRFFPTLGNHDWQSMSCSGGSCSGAYFDYFDLPSGPGDERYYDFVWGDVHFFAVDSDTDEPDGTTAGSTQGIWLQNALAASTAQWKVVYFHHAAYSSSSNHGSEVGMQWPFASWGADAVIGGHDHTYERIFQDGIVYFVNGLGGRSIYAFGTPIAGSQVRYNADYGAQLVTASADSINFKFINRLGAVIDSYTLARPAAAFAANVTSGTAPLTVDFTDQTTGSPTSWGWDFGDAGTSTQQHAAHQYTTPGLYTVTLTATNTHGSDIETKVDYINVSAATPPVADFVADTTSGFAPLTVTFADLSTNTPASWNWNFGDTETSTEQHPTHQYDSVGVYTVTLTVTNADGSDQETKIDYVTVASPFSRFYALSETTHNGVQVQSFTSTHVDDDVFQILEEIQSEGSTTTQTSILDHRWTFEVSSGLSMLFRISAFRDDNTDGDDFEFAYSTDDVTYQPLFTVNDTVEAAYQTPVMSSLNGTVYVRVRDTDRERGRVSKDKIHVDHMYFEALQTGVAPEAAFAATPASGGVPLDVSFTDLSSYAPTSWEWDFGDGESSTEQHPVHAYASAGTFDVSLTVTNPSGSDVETKVAYVTVSAWPSIHVSDIVVSRTGDYWMRGTASVTVSDTTGVPVTDVTVEGVFSAPNPASFIDLTDGSGIAMLQSDRTKSPPSNWCFEVTSVSKAGAVYDPGANVYTSRCEDGTSPDDPLASLSKGETVLGGLENHPNPFNPTTAVSFRLDRERPVRIEIFDQLGRRVTVLTDEVFEAGEHTVRWDASGYATGAYLYRLVSEDYVATRMMLLLK